MAVLRRLGTYLLAFLAVMALFVATGLWRGLDYAFYRALYLDRPDAIMLADEIRLIDVPYPESLRQKANPEQFRERLADLLAVIAGQSENLPRAVILDAWISKDDRGLAPLEQAIGALDKLGVRTYASFNPEAEGQKDFDRLMQEHAQSRSTSVNSRGTATHSCAFSEGCSAISASLSSDPEPARGTCAPCRPPSPGTCSGRTTRRALRSSCRSARKA